MKKIILTLGLILATMAILTIAVILSPKNNEMEMLREKFREANKNITSYTLTSYIKSDDTDAKATEYVDTSKGCYMSYYIFTVSDNNLDAAYQNYIFARDDIKTDAVKDVNGYWVVKTTDGNSESIIGLYTALDTPKDINSNVGFSSNIDVSKSNSEVYVVNTCITSIDYTIKYEFTINKFDYLIKHVTIHEENDGKTSTVEQDYTNYNKTVVPLDESFTDYEILLTKNSPYFIDSNESSN